MEENRYTAAIIIRRSDWRETDSRVTAYTERYGKLSLIARGTKKPGSKLAGHIEPCSLADIMVLSGRNRDYLASAAITDGFLSIKGDLNALYYAGQALAWLDKVTKDEEADKPVFGTVVSFLEQLDGASRDGLSRDDGAYYLLAFKVRTLAASGYCPELYHRLDCHKRIEPGKNYFQVKLGGLFCEDCYNISKKQFLPNEILTISDNCIKILRFLLEEQESKIKLSRNQRVEAENIINSFLTFI